MKTILACSRLIVGLALSTGFVLAASYNPPAELLAKATVSQSAATKTALAAKPGAKVKEVELEEEDGRLVWSFDLVTEHSTDVTEIQVDAKSGKIVSTKTESAADEADEAKADKPGKK